MKAGFRIREFVFPEDYQPVIRLWQEAGPGVHVGLSDRPQEIAKKLRRDADLFLVAEIGGEIIGSVLGGFDGRRGLVYHLAVIQSHTGKGVGSALMEELERRLHAKGCLRSYLLVTRDNAEAMHFYAERGWEPMDLLVYGKDLE